MPGVPGNRQPRDWLLITVSTAAAPDSLRVYVWRRLRLLGAVYLHQSVCMLPALDGVRKEITRFTERVRRDGGTVRVLGIQLTDEADQRQLIAEFNQARDSEYREVLQRLPGLTQELDTERQRGRTTYAEVEESEADLERFRAWLAKIGKRDYFHASQGDAARQALDRSASAVADFEAAAFAAEAQDAPGRAGCSGERKRAPAGRGSGR